MYESKMENAEVGNCACCLYSVCNGDLGFICANPESDQWGMYNSGCNLYKEG